MRWLKRLKRWCDKRLIWPAETTKTTADGSRGSAVTRSEGKRTFDLRRIRTSAEFFEGLDGLYVRVWTDLLARRQDPETGSFMSLIGELIYCGEFIIIKQSEDAWTFLPLDKIGMLEIEPAPEVDEIKETSYIELTAEEKFEAYYQRLKQQRRNDA
jgi:hypothetical protein